MFAQSVWIFDFTSWLTWLHLAMGLGVAYLVFTSTMAWLRRRHQGGLPEPPDEDLPWEELLELMKERYQGSESAENLDTNELCQVLLSQLPKDRPSTIPRVPEDEAFLGKGSERRRGRRRWFNPTVVSFYSPLQNEPLHGIVVNRSTGGLGMLSDSDFPQGTILFVRSVEAPAFISPVKVQVRHSRPAGRMWLVGCQFCEELPWNIKVWFG
jgi:PilZ domain